MNRVLTFSIFRSGHDEGFAKLLWAKTASWGHTGNGRLANATVHSICIMSRGFLI